MADIIDQIQYWEKESDHLLLELPHHTPLEWCEKYREVSYWTTVVPIFLLEALTSIKKQEKYSDLIELCEKLRGESRYPYFYDYIINPLLRQTLEERGISADVSNCITYDEAITLLSGGYLDFREIEKRQI